MPSRPVAAAVVVLVTLTAAGCRSAGGTRTGPSPSRDPGLASPATMRTALTEVRADLAAPGRGDASADERVARACQRLTRLEEAVRTDPEVRERVGYGAREALRLRLAMHDCPNDLPNARIVLGELIDPPRPTPPPGG